MPRCGSVTIERSDDRRPALADYSRSHRRRAAARERAGRRALHRRVEQGHRPGARRRPPSRARCSCCEQWLDDLRPLLEPFDVPVFVGAPERARSAHGLQPAPRGARLDAPPAAAARWPRCCAGRAPGRRARGHRRPHQRRRDLPLRGRPRRRCRARHPALRRPALPPQRAREHGDGAAGAVDAPARVAGRVPSSCTAAGFHDRRSRPRRRRP